MGRGVSLDTCQGAPRPWQPDITAKILAMSTGPLRTELTLHGSPDARPAGNWAQPALLPGSLGSALRLMTSSGLSADSAQAGDPGAQWVLTPAEGWSLCVPGHMWTVQLGWWPWWPPAEARARSKQPTAASLPPAGCPPPGVCTWSPSPSRCLGVKPARAPPPAPPLSSGSALSTLTFTHRPEFSRTLPAHLPSGHGTDRHLSCHTASTRPGPTSPQFRSALSTWHGFITIL